MKELFFDGAGWPTKEDVYEAFCRAVSAPLGGKL
jgi:hypothetical protein